MDRVGSAGPDFMCVHEYSHIRIDSSIFGIRIHIYLDLALISIVLSLKCQSGYLCGNFLTDIKSQKQSLSFQISMSKGQPTSMVYISVLCKVPESINGTYSSSFSVVPGAVLS